MIIVDMPLLTYKPFLQYPYEYTKKMRESYFISLTIGSGKKR